MTAINPNLTTSSSAIAAPAPSSSGCSREGCERAHCVRGLCQTHYQALQRVDLSIGRGRRCSAEGCERKHYSRGLCRSCYGRARYAADLETSRARIRQWQRTPNGRLSVNRSKQKRRRAVRGRVCSSCSRSDAVTLWSNVLARCAACERRGRLNGFCPAGAALYAGKRCACTACSSSPALTSKELTPS